MCLQIQLKEVRFITVVTDKTESVYCADGDHVVTGEAGEGGESGEVVEVVQVGIYSFSKVT